MAFVLIVGSLVLVAALGAGAGLVAVLIGLSLMGVQGFAQK